MIINPDIESQYTSRIDEASATITYVGHADPGSAEGVAVWRIKKIDSSGVLKVLFADGDKEFNNIWTDRASLTYS